MKKFSNLPRLLNAATIDSEIRPTIFDDIKDKSNVEIINVLKFYKHNCLNKLIANTSYTYSYARAAVDVICDFTDTPIPMEVLNNDKDRVTNQDDYRTVNVITKINVKSKIAKLKSKSACRKKVQVEAYDKDFVVTETRSINKPSVSALLRLNHGKFNKH